MTPDECLVRRATIDDLGGLRLLWDRARLQVLDLERHVTEFQLAASPEGELFGAVALRVEGRDGVVHSEALTQTEGADACRAALWARLQNVARNHGLVRLWTQEEAPFWHTAGFLAAPPELLARLPKGLAKASGHWSILNLKEEAAAAVSIEHEFELFQQSQRESTEQLMRQARVFKVLAWILIVAFLAVVVTLIFRTARRP